jgi:serine/threonine-protein kinase
MSAIRITCPACKHAQGVRENDLDKSLSCKSCGQQFRVERLEDYALLDELGRGAFGIVWRAYDTRLKREVALKQLNEMAIPEHEVETWVKRAVTEASALAKIDFHPNVLPLYNAGYYGRKFYMVTPVIRGPTLDKLIPEEGFPDPLKAVGFATTILRALQHIHKFKVYHRDVKPSNVMLGEAGNVFLVDFGLAACQQMEVSTWTEAGTVLGTPAYMPPEQARGEVSRVGPWSDQYGAGVVLYKMLTGRVPYPGKGYMVLADVGDYKKPPLPPRHFRRNLDPELESLILRAIAKFPGDRFESCIEFASALDTWAKKWSKRNEPQPPLALPVEKSHSRQRTQRREYDRGTAPRSRMWLWLLLGLLLLGGLAATVYFAFIKEKPAKQKFDDFTR